MLVSTEFVSKVVELINHVDQTGLVRQNTIEGNLFGVRLATNRKEYDGILTFNLRGDGWMVSLTGRRSKPKTDTTICQSEHFNKEDRKFWLFNCCIISGEKLEADWAILSLILE